MAQHELTDVRGIGPRTADSLMARGIDSVAALAAAPVEMLSKLPGFFDSRSLAVKAAAAELLGPSAAGQERSADAAERAKSTRSAAKTKAATGTKDDTGKAVSKKPAEASAKKKKKKKKKAAKKAEKEKKNKSKSKKADSPKSKKKKKKKKA